MSRRSTALSLLILLLVGCGPFATYDVRRPLAIETVPQTPADVAEFSALYPGTEPADVQKSLGGARSALRYFDIYKRDEGRTYLQLQTLARALERMDKNPYAWIQLGAYLALMHQSPGAIDATERGLKSVDDACSKTACSDKLKRLRTIGLINLAMYYTAADRPLESSFALELLDPEEQPAFYALAYHWTAADTAMQLGDLEGAEAALESARMTVPEQTATRDQKFDYPQYFAEKRDAIQVYLEGQLALERGDFTSAKTALEKAKVLDADLWDARVALGNLAFAEKRYDQTVGELLQLLEDAPKKMLFRPERVYFNLGNAYYELYKKTGDVAQLRSAADAFTQADTEVRDRYRRARQAARKADAVERDPKIAGFFVDALAGMQNNYGDALNNLGLVRQEQSRRASAVQDRTRLLIQAEETWQRALHDQRWSDRDLAYTNLARLYVETGRIPAAVEAAQHSMAHNPRNIAAVQELVDVVLRHPDRAEAARVAYAVALLIKAHYEPSMVPLLKEWFAQMAAALPKQGVGSREVERARLAIEAARVGIERVRPLLEELESIDRSAHWTLVGLAAGDAPSGEVGNATGQLTGGANVLGRLTAVIDAPLDITDWISRRERGEAYALRGRLRLERKETAEARHDLELAAGDGVDHHVLAGAVAILREELSVANLPALGSLAVLPFTGLAADEALWPRAFAGELAAALRRTADMKVVAVQPDTAAVSVIDKTDVARRHGAGAALSGTLSIEDEHLVVDVLLTDALDERTLFAQRYGSSVDELQSLLGTIVSDVMAAVRVPVRAGGPVAALPTANGPAFKRYLRGMEALIENDPEQMRRALDEFTGAIRHESSFASAYAGMALAQYGVANLYEHPHQVMTRARTAAESAVRHDPENALAQLALATVRSWYDWKFDEAEVAFRRAVQLDPENAIVHRLYGDLLLATRNRNDGLQQKQIAADLAPLSPTAQIDLAAAFFYVRRYPEAIRQVQRALTLNPSSPRAYAWLSWIHAYRGDYKAARVALETAILYAGRTPFLLSHLAVIEAREGRPAPAHLILRDLESKAQAGREYVLPLLIARVYTALHDFNAARPWLRKAIEDRSESMVWLPIDPWLEPLRGNGLEELIADVKE